MAHRPPLFDVGVHSLAKLGLALGLAKPDADARQARRDKQALTCTNTNIAWGLVVAYAPGLHRVPHSKSAMLR